jgi:hypothetical protein
MPRRFAIFQFPNPPLIAAMVAAAIARPTRSYNAMQLSRVALFVWSAAEITTGANWFRRSLGVAGGVYSRGALTAQCGGGRPRAGAHRQTKVTVSPAGRV